MPREVSHAAACGISGAHDDIEAIRFESGKHLGQDSLVVLKIGIHDGNKRRRGCHHALDTCGRQAAAKNALQNANIVTGSGDFTDASGGPISGIVIDEDDFILDAC